MAASTWPVIINECLQKDNNYPVNIIRISKGILERELTLLEFVTFLEKYLTDNNEEIRSNGCQLLADILHKLPRDHLTTKEANSLSVFFRDRLQDHDLVIKHILNGLVALSDAENLSANDAVAISLSLFREIGPNNQTRTQTDRLNVFRTLHNLLNFHLCDLKTMGLDFVAGIIQMIDGETDPKNLLTVFKLVPKVIQNFPIDPFVEDLFEVTGCYFPIDYKPQSGDPNGVSVEELVLSLRKCLASTPKFAEFCMPMILEKIDSDVEDAKVEALFTLAECASVYGSTNLRSFYSDAWRSIRREICSSRVNDRVEKVALDALTAVIKSTCATVILRDGHDDFKRLLDEILTESVSTLRQSPFKLSFQTAKMLQAVVVASDTACERVVETVVPLLLEQYSFKIEHNHRNSIVDILNGFLECCRQLTNNDFGPLGDYKSSLLGLYTGIVEEPLLAVSLKQAAIKGLLTIVLTTPLLDVNETAVAIQQMAKVILHSDNESVRHDSLETISEMANKHHKIINESLLPHLLGTIKSMDTLENEALYKNHLKLLAAVVTSESDSLATVTSNLLSELDVTLFTNKSVDHTKLAALSECLLDIATKASLERASFWQSEVLLPLLQFSYANWDMVTDTIETGTIGNTAKILQIVVPHLNAGESSTLLLLALKTFLQSDPIKISDPKLIVFVESILRYARRELLSNDSHIPREYLDALVTKSLDVIKDERIEDDSVPILAASCMANLVNKMDEGDYLEHLVSALLGNVSIQQWRDKPSTSTVVKLRVVTLLTWLTKALTMRGHPKADAYIDEMFAHLNDISTCDHAADGFQFVSNDLPNGVSHANVRLFYKQRFYVSTSHKLIQGFENSTSSEIQHSYLKALALQLQLIPKESFTLDLPTLLPILMKGLLCDCPTLLATILTTLADMLQSDPNLVLNYADTLIARLLNLSTYKGAMKVRIAALGNIYLMIKLPAHLTVRHKDQVVRKLAATLDDPKRLVRKAAVKAITNWFLIGSPGGI